MLVDSTTSGLQLSKVGIDNSICRSELTSEPGDNDDESDSPLLLPHPNQSYYSHYE